MPGGVASSGHVRRRKRFAGPARQRGQRISECERGCTHVPHVAALCDNGLCHLMHQFWSMANPWSASDAPPCRMTHSCVSCRLHLLFDLFHVMPLSAKAPRVRRSSQRSPCMLGGRSCGEGFGDACSVLGRCGFVMDFRRCVPSFMCKRLLRLACALGRSHHETGVAFRSFRIGLQRMRPMTNERRLSVEIMR